MHIRTKEGFYKRKKLEEEKLELHIGFKHLTEIEIHGIVSIKSDQYLKFGDLNIKISGASSIKLELSANSLNIDSSGASYVMLTGKSEEIDVDLSGAGTVKHP